MDFKGITWAGNIYQKFESMCLEVEEVMYQDTVKYVENQVQTVGSSVKKFYSEVMQDLLPPSCVDPVKTTASDFSPNSFARNELMKKPKPSIKGNPTEVKLVNIKKNDEQGATDKVSFGGLHYVVNKKSTDETDTVANQEVKCTSSVGGLACVNRPPPTLVSVKSLSSELDSGESSGGRVFNRPVFSLKESPRDHCLSKMSGSSTNSVFGGHSTCERTGSYREESGSLNVTLPSLSVERYDLNEAADKICNFIDQNAPDTPIDSPPSHANLLIKSAGQEQADFRSIPATAIFEGTSVNHGSVLQTSSNASSDASNRYMGEEVVMPTEDERDTDTSEVDDYVEPELEIVGQFHESKLEETCIWVEGDKLICVPQSVGQAKSYKKRLQQVFSSKMRSARKQEYEQLTAQYECPKSDHESLKRVELVTNVDSNTQCSSSHDFPESEWELL